MLQVFWVVERWEYDYITFKDEVDGISSSLREDFSNGNTRFGEEVANSIINTKLEHIVSGLESNAIMLTVCVLKWC